MTPPNEPNAIALLREGVFVPNAVDCDHILAAYDAIVSERDEWRDAAKWAEGQHQHWKTVAEAATAQRDEARRLHMVVRNELDTLRARLAACERVVGAAFYEGQATKYINYSGALCTEYTWEHSNARKLLLVSPTALEGPRDQ